MNQVQKIYDDITELNANGFSNGEVPVWDGDNFVPSGIDTSVVDNHIADLNNPHQVTKTQVGLSNVPNLDTTSAVNNSHISVTVLDSSTINFNINGQEITGDVVQSGIDHNSISNIGTNSHSQIDLHLANTNNPHNVTTSQIGAVPSGIYTASDILGKLITVDGSGSGLDADLLDGVHVASLSSFVVDTKQSILTSTATSGKLGISTDTSEVFLADGSIWRKLPFKLVQDTSSPDMGSISDSSRIGYGTDYITDKKLSNVSIGYNNSPTNGAVRVNNTVSPNTLEIYLRNAWYSVLYDLTYINGEFEHTPLSYSIDVWSGNSNALALNGLPLIQEYKVSMGCMQRPLIINGGTF